MADVETRADRFKSNQEGMMALLNPGEWEEDCIWRNNQQVP